MKSTLSALLSGASCRKTSQSNPPPVAKIVQVIPPPLPGKFRKLTVVRKVARATLFNSEKIIVIHPDQNSILNKKSYPKKFVFIIWNTNKRGHSHLHFQALYMIRLQRHIDGLYCKVLIVKRSKWQRTHRFTENSVFPTK